MNYTLLFNIRPDKSTKPKEVSITAWMYIFQKKISIFEMDILKSAPNRLEQLFSKDVINALHTNGINRTNIIIFCLLSRRPKIEIPTLIRITTQLYKRALRNNIHSIAPYFTKTNSKRNMPSRSLLAFKRLQGSEKASILKKLVILDPYQLKQQIKSRIIPAFWSASRDGRVDKLKKLIDQSPTQARKLLEYGDFYAFHIAISKSHINVINYIQELDPELFNKMLSVNNHKHIKQALRMASPKVIAHFIKLSPSLKILILNKWNDFFSRGPMLNGGLDKINFLYSFWPKQFKELILEKKSYYSSVLSYENDINVFKRIVEITQDRAQELFAEEYMGNNAFNTAVAYRNKELAQYFFNEFPALVK